MASLILRLAAHKAAAVITQLHTADTEGLRFTGDAGDPLEPDHRGANNRVGPTEVNPERVCVCGGVRRLQESDLRDIARVPAMFFNIGGG